MSTDSEIDQFIKDRDEALLSLDLNKVRDYMRKYSGIADRMSDEVLKVAMHKARTGCKHLPLEARMLSKRWLTERNFKSADDGELS